MLPRTIVISIIDFILLECEEYHSFFQPLEVTRHTLLSDKMGFHFFELPKLPAYVSEDNMLLLWLSLFRAETEEELEKIKEMEAPVMSQAYNARKERDIEIAKKLLKRNRPVDEIMEDTGLTYEEVKDLCIKS